MPPALSEDEASASETEIPYKNVDKQAAKKAHVETKEEENDEPQNDEEGDGEEFKVDKIMSHTSDDRDKIVKYEVKWVGYPKISDRTWEPRDNLWDEDLDCPIDQLQAYWDKHCGGIEPKYMTKAERAKAKKEAGLDRKSGETPKTGAGQNRKLSQTGTPATTEKGRRKSGRGNQSSTPQDEDLPAKKTLQLPSGSWEKEISSIDTIEEERDQKTGNMTRYAYVEWVDPKRSRSKHSLALLRIKCPMKMLDYYEQHLVFNPQEPNGDGDMMVGVDSDMFMED
ncbi:hypothetical protein HDK77DRAFT_252541 [Phyllosticta capitalensis]|uniref:Chromo domain-containing protein n=1 Tax=Phyllosticta capitalensis TaxID=121624 RepID=A0ABR1YLN4_9PEZI